MKYTINGKDIEFETRNGYYYWNGLTFLPDYDAHDNFRGMSVKAFDSKMYENSKCIILPDWVTRIQWGSIPESLRESLEYIYAPGVKVIEEHAFFNCSSLKGCVANNVEVIGSAAFKCCSNLLYTPNLTNIKIIKNEAFSSCYSLRGHYTESGDIVEDEILIPKNINKLTDTFAFDENITRVVFEPRKPRDCSLELVGTFNGCVRLSELKGIFDGGPNDKKINVKYAAFGKTGVQSIVISSDFSDKSSDPMEGYWFVDCLKLKNIEINTKIIPEGLCSGCINLKEIKIGDNVQTIWEHAFEKNTSLEYVGLNNVEFVEKKAFAESGIQLISANKKFSMQYDSFSHTPAESMIASKYNNSKDMCL